jgi:hypothetical protein
MMRKLLGLNLFFWLSIKEEEEEFSGLRFPNTMFYIKNQFKTTFAQGGVGGNKIR